MTVSLNSESHAAGTVPGGGSFACVDCAAAIVLTTLDELPECPECGGMNFRRASLFEHSQPAEHPTAEAQLVSEPVVDEWLDEVRSDLDGTGHFIAFRDEANVRLMTLEEGWTRIGRSVAADIRLDDPTVSRRHALLVLEDGAVRVLDDRSLNGVRVNDEPVDLRALEDGDEFAIGRYRLHYLEP